MAWRRQAEVSIWETDHFVEPAVASEVYCQYVWSLEYIDTPLFRDRDADNDNETGGHGVAASGLEERLAYLTDRAERRPSTCRGANHHPSSASGPSASPR